MTILDQFKRAIERWYKNEPVVEMDSSIDAIKISLYECLQTPGITVIMASEVLSIVCTDSAKAVRELQFSELLRTSGEQDPINSESEAMWVFENGSRFEVRSHSMVGECDILIGNLHRSCPDETKSAIKRAEPARVILC